MQQRSTSGGGDKGNLQKIGEGVGGLAGQAADTAMGMFASMMNGMGGWWAQTASQQQGQQQRGRSFGAEQDRACRSHFEASVQGGARSYEDVRPLYQFGHLAGQNPDYQGRSFEEVEPELKRNWGQEQSQRFGDWPEVRGYVDFGYSQDDSGDASGEVSGRVSGETGG